MSGIEDDEPPGSDIVSKIHLPFTFEVHPSINNSHPLVITILQKLNNVLLDKLSLPVFRLDEQNDKILSQESSLTNNQRIFKLQTDIHQLLLSLRTDYFFVKIQKRVSDKDQHLGLVFNIVGHFYGIMDLPDNTNFKDIVSDEYSTSRAIRHPQQLIPNIESNSTKYQELSEAGKTIVAEFSMKPPDIQNPSIPSTISNKVVFSPHTEENPLQFLYSRYFTILYSLSTPLSYFPKTALTRLANLCDNDPTTISNTLKKLVWKIDEMDERHQNKYGIIKALSSQNLGSAESPELSNKATPSIEDTLKTKYESRSQVNFISKHESILQDFLVSSTKREATPDDIDGVEKPSLSIKEVSSEQLVQKLFMELKIREGQLQVLVLLELIKVWNIDETKFIDECLKRQKKDAERKSKESKQSLVRKKKPKSSRKIIPTFLGMGINVRNYDKINLNQEDNVNKFILFSNLDTIVDRMGLWDTLLGRTQGNDNDSAYGFLAYVLVPYFNKKLPVLLKFIIDKIKDSNMKLVTKSFKTFEKEVMKRTLILESGSRPDDLSGEMPARTSDVVLSQKSSDTIRPSKFRKTLIQKVPTLKKSATFDLSAADDLKPAFSLKRSKSNLSSKHLQKRQVDISVSTDKIQKDKASRNSNLSEYNDDTTFIFGKSKKIRSIPQAQISSQSSMRNQSVSQVQATPSKDRIKDLGMTNPSSRKPGASKTEQERASITTNIQATPAKRSINMDRSKSLPQIESTPVSSKVLDFEMVLNTPEDKFIKPSVVHSNTRSATLADRLLHVATASSMEVISPGEDNYLKAGSPIAKPQRTPQERITSSPILQNSSNSKRKPGDPISVQESPFFDSNFNGSPVFGTKSSGIFGLRKSTKE